MNGQASGWWQEYISARFWSSVCASPLTPRRGTPKTKTIQPKNKGMPSSNMNKYLRNDKESRIEAGHILKEKGVGYTWIECLLLVPKVEFPQGVETVSPSYWKHWSRNALAGQVHSFCYYSGERSQISLGGCGIVDHFCSCWRPTRC